MAKHADHTKKQLSRLAVCPWRKKRTIVRRKRGLNKAKGKNKHRFHCYGDFYAYENWKATDMTGQDIALDSN